jgi:hypothetical protein
MPPYLSGLLTTDNRLTHSSFGFRHYPHPPDQHSSISNHRFFLRVLCVLGGQTSSFLRALGVSVVKPCLQSCRPVSDPGIPSKTGRGGDETTPNKLVPFEEIRSPSPGFTTAVPARRAGRLSANSPAKLGIWARFDGLFLARLRKYGLVLPLFPVTIRACPPKRLGSCPPVHDRQDAGQPCFPTDLADGIGPQTIWKPLAQTYG